MWCPRSPAGSSRVTYSETMTGGYFHGFGLIHLPYLPIAQILMDIDEMSYFWLPSTVNPQNLPNRPENTPENGPRRRNLAPSTFANPPKSPGATERAYGPARPFFGFAALWPGILHFYSISFIRINHMVDSRGRYETCPRYACWATRDKGLGFLGQERERGTASGSPSQVFVVNAVTASAGRCQRCAPQERCDLSTNLCVPGGVLAPSVSILPSYSCAGRIATL